MSRRELAVDLLSVSVLGVWCGCLFAAGAWQFAAQPGREWVAAVFAVMAARPPLVGGQLGGPRE
jgi:hypothetical protein